MGSPYSTLCKTIQVSICMKMINFILNSDAGSVCQKLWLALSCWDRKIPFFERIDQIDIAEVLGESDERQSQKESYRVDLQLAFGLAKWAQDRWGLSDAQEAGNHFKRSGTRWKSEYWKFVAIFKEILTI